MIGNKIKALLNLTNKTTNDVCGKLDILEAAYYRKIKRNTFKTEELIKIASLTNTKLAFLDQNGNVLVAFNEDDLIK